jgi:excisionase family DNA binding protein
MTVLDENSLEQLADAIAERVAAKLAERAERKYLSREEYAQIHGLGMRTIDRAIAEGRLTVERSGRRVMIPANAKIVDRA